MMSWNVAIPIYSTLFLDGNAALAARIAGARADDGRRRDLVDADPLPRRRRDAGRRRVDAGLAAQVAAVRASAAVSPRRAPARRASSPTPSSDLPMKLVLIGIVLFALPLLRALPGDRRRASRSALPMTVIMIVAGFLFCSVSALHGGARRLVEQPGLRHHDRDDPVRRRCCCSR